MIGGFLAFVVVTILALPFYEVHIPILSSYIQMIFLVKVLHDHHEVTILVKGM